MATINLTVLLMVLRTVIRANRDKTSFDRFTVTKSIICTAQPANLLIIFPREVSC